MDVRLSAEQTALRDSAAQLADRFGPKAVSQLHNAERAAKLDAAMAAAGWRELRIADADGKPLASAVEVALVAEELGYAVADTPFLGPTLAADLRRRAGAAPCVSTETVVLTGDLADLARVTGAAGSGTAVDARGSHAGLAVCPDGSGYQLVSVPVNGSSVRQDLTRSVAGPDLGTATPLAGATRALTSEDLAAWSAVGLALACADLVGVMRGSIKLARDYALVRRQYGATIGSFQAVQHLLADALVAMEGSRSAALYAAWAADALPPDQALLAAGVAKAYCGRAARAVCETAVQVHGGIGNTWECMAHVYLRRALVSTEILGGVGASLAYVLAARGLQAGAHGLR